MANPAKLILRFLFGKKQNMIYIFHNGDNRKHAGGQV